MELLRLSWRERFCRRGGERERERERERDSELVYSREDNYLLKLCVTMGLIYT